MKTSANAPLKAALQRLSQSKAALPPSFRRGWAGLSAFLALSRLPALPTVWSNCLAGWWLGGHRNAESLPQLCIGVTCLYLGGSFLNDAFDVEHDSVHHPLRPIPSGVLRRQTVWRWALGWLIAGALCLLFLGPLTGAIGLGLVVIIILANAVHRLLPFSPVFPALARLLLYLIGGTVSERAITGWVLWSGLAIALYVLGIGLFARWRNPPKEARTWPALFLAAPIVLAGFMNAGAYSESALLLAIVFILWTVRSLRHIFWSLDANPALAVSQLVTGIVLADWLAAADASRAVSFVFLGLALAAAVLRRVF